MKSDIVECRPLLRMNLSFAGCGLLAIYHLGVAKMLVTHGPRFMMNVQRFGGASAGALVASVLAVRGCNLQVIEDSTKFAYELARDVRRWPLGVLTPGRDLLQPLEGFLSQLMPDDCHLIATNRLFISVTDSLTKKNEIVSRFESKQELIEYLLASSYIPVLTGTRPTYVNGKKYYDGGMTDNLPVFNDGRNITVSPFDGGQDICPHSVGRNRWYITMHNQSYRLSLRNFMRGTHTFIPPSDRVLAAYHEQGMADAKRFLIAEGYYDRNSSHLLI